MLVAAPRFSKINREVSNFIVALVLERADDLIRNSYRRLTTENVARNEHWAKIAEIVNEHYDTGTETERVKSHFHNRKKVLTARMKEEIKNINGSGTMTIDEKLEELIKRRICVGEHDEQLARVCLEVEEEEKNRTDLESITISMIGEKSNHSLLSQLLSQPINGPAILSREEVSIKDESEQLSRTPLLSKLLSEPSTSKSNQSSQETTYKTINNHTVKEESLVNERKRATASPSQNYLSHLIVDITSPNELKRLLALLIDNGFCRFQHVKNLPNPQLSYVSGFQSQPEISNSLEYGRFEGYNASSKNLDDFNMDILKDIERSKVERVDVEVKVEAGLENYEDFGTAPDEQTPGHCSDEPESNDDDEGDIGMETKLEMELETDPKKKVLNIFSRNGDFLTSPSKRVRLSGENTMVPCEMCNAVLRLNTGGSKWNLYEHVMLKHSNHRAYKCALCNYEAARKIRIRKHAHTQHKKMIEPIDVTTPEIRKEWLKIMSECFPQHQYGKNTIASKIYSPDRKDDALKL